MLIDVVFVIAAGALGLALAATAPMLGAAVALGRTVKVVIGADVGDGAVVAPVLLGFAEPLALARGVIDGEADGRGAAGAGNTGGSTNGDSMSRSIVRAKPSDCARSSSASVAPNVARRRRCVTFAFSFVAARSSRRRRRASARRCR